ncbi:hypothetical protein DUI87_32785 [Hirundo rustica rustica]|uniref:Peptidase A2 domain-containing protein n=1 Tax=Hirundo rustica rustica TaxID=333673 RepID=A0A3M0IQN6_HIRRU|nr:hypothetical protein DUI87_32785 [Hirundo rustica rustica]
MLVSARSIDFDDEADYQIPTGVADTESDITIIAHSKWPQGWELVNGVISGFGGAATSTRSKRSIVIEGTDGQIDINSKEQLQAELQETEARINARDKRLEEKMKIIREILNPLPQVLQKQVAIKKINLQDLRKKELNINELTVMKLSRNNRPGQLYRQCLQGLDFLHSNHVIHQDVKSRDILLRTNVSVKLVSPVVHKGSRGGHNVRAVHHPFSQATIRGLCKAHRDYGRDSPYFRGLLRSDVEAAVVIPADLRQLFSCLLDSTEFKLWEAAWRQLLREALPSLLTDPETAIDENENALTLEHLMGEGRWTDPTDQALGIPIKALTLIREHAVTAFFSMVPDGPVIPYYKIIQGTKEAFTKFAERLTRAIEVQVAEVAMREGILREVVFANENNLRRNVILSLLLDPPPTIQDMLRVCQLKVPFMQGYD